MYQGPSKDLDACFQNLDTKIDPFSSLLIFAAIPVQKFFFHLVGCDYWNAPGMGVKLHGDDFLIFLVVDQLTVTPGIPHTGVCLSVGYGTVR